MEKVESFINDLRQRHNFHLVSKANIEQDDVGKMMMEDLIETTDILIQAKENLSKNLHFLSSNRHSIHKVIQDSETTKGLPISVEYQQQALNLFTEGITFINNFKDIEKILNADKDTNLSKSADDLVKCTKVIENDLKKMKLSFNQLEALHMKIEELKTTLIIFDSEDQPDMDDSVFN